MDDTSEMVCTWMSRALSLAWMEASSASTTTCTTTSGFFSEPSRRFRGSSSPHARNFYEIPKKKWEKNKRITTAIKNKIRWINTEEQRVRKDTSERSLHPAGGAPRRRDSAPTWREACPPPRAAGTPVSCTPPPPCPPALSISPGPASAHPPWLLEAAGLSDYWGVQFLAL